MNKNPYEVTQIDGTIENGSHEEPIKPSFGKMAASVFFGWERLRLPFNLVFAAFVWLISPPYLSGLEVLGALVRSVVAANVCFFAGPILEILLCFVAIRGLWVRWLLFSIGTLLFMCLMFILLSGAWLPDQE